MVALTVGHIQITARLHVTHLHRIQTFDLETFFAQTISSLRPAQSLKDPSSDFTNKERQYVVVL